MNIVLFATAWGPLHGGINSFNMDLAIGLSRVAGTSSQIHSVVPRFSTGEQKSANDSRVKLLSYAGPDNADLIGPDEERRLLDILRAQFAPGSVDLWIGHDTITGFQAIAAHLELGKGSQLALIHHMDYAEYKGYADDQSHSGEDRQRELFRTEGAHLFAVGPYLQKSCARLSDWTSTVTTLVPGFPSVRIVQGDFSSLRAIVTGRLDEAHDRIKQGRLAIRAIGAAVRDARVARLDGRPHLAVVGIAGTEDRDALIEIAEHEAGRVVDVTPVPFETDRSKFLDRVARSNLAFMLSWHEGFGLTGWEAIAAEVPLVLTRHSGLYQLIRTTDDGSALPFIEMVEIEGRRGGGVEDNYTPNDIVNVTRAVVNRVEDLARSRAQARRLRKLLIEVHGCTWDDTARTLLKGVGLSVRDSEPITKSSPNSPTIQVLLEKLFGDNPFHAMRAELALTEVEPSILAVEFGIYIDNLSDYRPQDSLLRAARVFGRTGNLGIATLVDRLRNGSWNARQVAAPLFQHLPREASAGALYKRLRDKQADMDEYRCVLESLGWIGRWESSREMREMIGFTDVERLLGAKDFVESYYFEKLSPYVYRAHVLIAALASDAKQATESLDYFLDELEEFAVTDHDRLTDLISEIGPLFRAQNVYEIRSWAKGDPLRCSVYSSIVVFKRFVWVLDDMAFVARREDIPDEVRRRALQAIGEIGTKQSSEALFQMLLQHGPRGDRTWSEALQQAASYGLASNLYHLSEAMVAELRELVDFDEESRLISLAANRCREEAKTNFIPSLSAVHERVRSVAAICYAVVNGSEARPVLKKFLADAPTEFDRFVLLLSLVRAGEAGLTSQLEEAVDPQSKWRLRGLPYFLRREIVFSIHLASPELAAAWAETLFVNLEFALAEVELVENC